jgi:hypothetical protein
LTSVQRLPAGRYYVTGAGNERAAVASFRVTGRAGRAKLPRVGTSLVALDYGFRSSRLRSGRQKVSFRNAGREPHHALLAPIRAGASLNDVRRFADGHSSGPPPVAYAGAPETAVLEGGQSQVTEMDLKPGRYAALCFVSDRAGGPSHVAKGMVAELRVR